MTQEIQTDTVDFHSSVTQTDKINKVDNFVQTEQHLSQTNTTMISNKPSATKSSSSISSTTSELVLKTRLDNLILEKNSLRARNEELIQELEATNNKMAFQVEIIF